MKISTTLLIILSLAISSSSCKKSTVSPTSSVTPTTPTTPTSYDFSAVDKVLNDSVPVKFNGVCML